MGVRLNVAVFRPQTYCASLARMLALLERHRLWHTLTALLRHAAEHAVYLKWRGQPVARGALSSASVKALLSRARHEDVTVAYMPAATSFLAAAALPRGHAAQGGEAGLAAAATAAAASEQPPRGPLRPESSSPSAMWSGAMRVLHGSLSAREQGRVEAARAAAVQSAARAAREPQAVDGLAAPGSPLAPSARRLRKVSWLWCDSSPPPLLAAVDGDADGQAAEDGVALGSAPSPGPSKPSRHMHRRSRSIGVDGLLATAPPSTSCALLDSGALSFAALLASNAAPSRSASALPAGSGALEHAAEPSALSPGRVGGAGGAAQGRRRRGSISEMVAAGASAALAGLHYVVSSALPIGGGAPSSASAPGSPYRPRRPKDGASPTQLFMDDGLPCASAGPDDVLLRDHHNRSSVLSASSSVAVHLLGERSSAVTSSALWTEGLAPQPHQQVAQGGWIGSSTLNDLLLSSMLDGGGARAQELSSSLADPLGSHAEALAAAPAPLARVHVGGKPAWALPSHEQGAAWRSEQATARRSPGGAAHVSPPPQQHRLSQPSLVTQAPPLASHARAAASSTVPLTLDLQPEAATGEGRVSLSSPSAASRSSRCGRDAQPSLDAPCDSRRWSASCGLSGEVAVTTDGGGSDAARGSWEGSARGAPSARSSHDAAAKRGSAQHLASAALAAGRSGGDGGWAGVWERLAVWDWDSLVWPGAAEAAGRQQLRAIRTQATNACGGRGGTHRIPEAPAAFAHLIGELVCLLLRVGPAAACRGRVPLAQGRAHEAMVRMCLLRDARRCGPSCLARQGAGGAADHDHLVRRGPAVPLPVTPPLDHKQQGTQQGRRRPVNFSHLVAALVAAGLTSAFVISSPSPLKQPFASPLNRFLF